MMKDDKAFWIQIAISAGISLLGSGIVYILAQIKEELPALLYNTVLVIISLFIIVALLALIVLLIQSTFGAPIKKQWDSWQKRRERNTEYQLVKDWRKKWQELGLIIDNVINRDWQPTKKQQKEYTFLHFWFRDNRLQFLPVWQRFSYHRPEAAHERYDSTTALGYIVFEENYKDPFSYFYKPLQIEELANILRGRQKGEIDRVLIKLIELLAELISKRDT
jgi:hypothetical protein